MKNKLILVCLFLQIIFVSNCSKNFQDSDIVSLDFGSQNLDLNGKTFEYINPAYQYIRKAEVTGISPSISTTYTIIPIAQRKITITFRTDKTFIFSEIISYVSGCDSIYNNTSNISYIYANISGDNTDFNSGTTADGHNHTGYEGKVFFSITYTGTWDSYTLTGANPQTLQYFINPSYNFLKISNRASFQSNYTLFSTTTYNVDVFNDVPTKLNYINNGVLSGKIYTSINWYPGMDVNYLPFIEKN